MYDILEGIKVVEVAEWVFVPTAGAVLGDWGADVVRVEHPVRGDSFRAMVIGGDADPVRAFMQTSHRSKRSIGIDIATPEGLTLLYKMVERADVFLTNFLPDARRRLKIDVEDIQSRNPRIIYGRGSGYGQYGAEANKGGFDVAATWSRAGIAYKMTPPEADEPAMMPGSVGDLNGGLTLAGGITAALFRRERTGRPAVVDVSLYGIGMWTNSQWINAAGLGIKHPPSSRLHPGQPLANPYRTKDNRWIWLAFMQPDRWWSDLCRRLQHPELAEDPRFVDAGRRQESLAECVAVLDAIIATKTLAEWKVDLADVEGVWDPVASPEEIYNDEQALVNGYLPEVLGDGTPLRAVASPMQFDGVPMTKVVGAPEPGQHTEEIMLEMGLTWEQIAGYKATGAIL